MISCGVSPVTMFITYIIFKSRVHPSCPSCQDMQTVRASGLEYKTTSIPPSPKPIPIPPKIHCSVIPPQATSFRPLSTTEREWPYNPLDLGNLKGLWGEGGGGMGWGGMGKGLTGHRVAGNISVLGCGTCDQLGIGNGGNGLTYQRPTVPPVMKSPCNRRALWNCMK